MIRVITIEREYGCGGSEIAAKLAELLGWKLGPRTNSGNRAASDHCGNTPRKGNNGR